MNKRNWLKNSVSIVGIAGVLAGVSTATHAQIDTIIVTGEKVDRSLQETASSVVVITDADDGENSVIEALTGIGNVIYNSSVGAPIIRGQDAQGANGGAAIFGGTVARATINLRRPLSKLL